MESVTYLRMGGKVSIERKKASSREIVFMKENV